MVEVSECAAWTWDARPYPFFPALSDVWTDGANWRLGHWLTGRLGAVSLAALVRHLCQRAGLPETRIDVSGLWGAAEGYAIINIDAVIACERPKIAPHTSQMRDSIAEALSTTPDRISIKGTTTEGLGYTGRGEGIACWAVATLRRLTVPRY